MIEQNAAQAACRKTWLVIGASRGIGLEFVQQLLDHGHRVFATARRPNASKFLESVRAKKEDEARCSVLECDVTSELSIKGMVASLSDEYQGKIDYVVVSAGVLSYPNRATELSFNLFAHHLQTNTIGPIITAQQLLKSSFDIGTICFMSSDSGSAAEFRAMEDGFAAYAASKAALNQMLRHMAEELKRRSSNTVILAMHPGEVITDMANIELAWEVKGSITPKESIKAMIPIIESKTIMDTGTFWTWEGKSYPW